jgi:hypothetical protein
MEYEGMNPCKQGPAEWMAHADRSDASSLQPALRVTQESMEPAAKDSFASYGAGIQCIFSRHWKSIESDDIDFAA